MSENKSLKDFDEVNNENKELIFDDIKDFLYLYFQKGDLNKYYIEKLFGYDNDLELPFIKAVHFMLSDEVRSLVVIIPKLIRNLAHSTRKETEIMRGRIRGKIDWNQTIKERFSQGFDDKSLFVCQPHLKYYDLEENQLLKFLLDKIIFIYREYLSIHINPKEDFDLSNVDSNQDWYQIVRDNYEISSRALKKVYFSNISSIKVVKPKHLRKCAKSRNKFYHKVVDAYKLYENLFIKDDEDSLKELIKNRVIKTTNPHKLYELYVFFYLVSKLKNSKLALLYYKGDTRDYAISGTYNDVNINIHYQFTPDDLSENSEYRNILENYNSKRLSTRSPDVIIEFDMNNKKYYRLVEVKNTSDADYMRSSIYKVMGYYKDFSKLKEDGTSNFTEEYPIVLVNYNWSNIKQDYNIWDDDVILLNRCEFLNSLNKLLMI